MTSFFVSACLFLIHIKTVFSLNHLGPKSRDITQEFGPNITRFAVHDLPEVNFSIPASWAGQIPIPNSIDNQLFFWLFEAESASDDLIIWLLGGPGCSSLGGLSKENGPLHFAGNESTPQPSPYAWTKLANILYIDQPVGTGFATGSSPAKNNAEVTESLYSWLKEFYKEFPGLTSKNTYLSGESYAAIYIPYLTQAILADPESLDINLKAIVIGDGNFGNVAALTDVAVFAFLKEQQDLLKLPQEILGAFELADQQCGFDQVIDQITYPPRGKIRIPGNPEQNNYKRDGSCVTSNPNTSSLIQESVNALCLGGCATWQTAYNYLTNQKPCFSQYSVSYDCSNAPDTSSFEAYLSQRSVQEAIHAPPTTFAECNFAIIANLTREPVPPPAYFIIPAILEVGIPIHFYAGDRDFLFNHIGEELMIQNMTWCGQQGFQSLPDRPFWVDGKIAGNWGAERGLTYHHIINAGHSVPYDNPSAAFTFMRDFVLGNDGYQDQSDAEETYEGGDDDAEEADDGEDEEAGDIHEGGDEDAEDTYEGRDDEAEDEGPNDQ